MKSALIILFKYPQIGKVKTRLAKSIGNKTACLFAQSFLADTLIRVNSDDYHIYPYINNQQFINNFQIDYQFKGECYVQSSGDLGQRMSIASQDLFAKGYEKVIIIGSDSPYITASLIVNAFSKLSQHDVIFGPCADGGYYLVGCREAQLLPLLFKDMVWSTEQVLSDSVARLTQANKRYHLLETYHDIDTIEDLYWCADHCKAHDFESSASMALFNQLIKNVMTDKQTATIGVIGGTGLYSILDKVTEQEIDTPFGKPSATIATGLYNGKKITFIPRHGSNHQIPPHQINYQANIWALKYLGIKFIISPCAAGSLQAAIKPGDFVIADQFVDRTRSRKDTFYDDASVTHMPAAQPFCNYLRQLSIDVINDYGVALHTKGTMVVIQGPRFSTTAESEWFTKNGWSIINMTTYPEVILARELEMSYVSLALITDYDAGLQGQFPSVNAKDAVAVFQANTQKMREIIFTIIDKIDIQEKTPSHTALETARF